MGTRPPTANDGAHGHRQRLKDRFMAGEAGSREDIALLELLLTYAIPQKDVLPLALQLLNRFGDLSGVLDADASTLASCSGLGSHSVTLIKLAQSICSRCGPRLEEPADETVSAVSQPTLFDFEPADPPEPVAEEDEEMPQDEGEYRDPKPPRPRRGAGMFARAVLKDSIEILPRIPDTDSAEEVRAFLRSNLRFNAEGTRYRFTKYIMRRMFPHGVVDIALRKFARAYARRQELRDVCFYRFCQAEPVMYGVVEDLLLPAIGSGQMGRERLSGYLTERFPTVKSIDDFSHAVIEALVDAGLIRVDRTKLTFAYREVLLPSFAFVLHSEFPEPDMYDIAKVEQNRAIQALLWNPDRILPALYELRNQGIIAKVSEIDRFRQFTTRWVLTEMVERLVAEKGKP